MGVCAGIACPLGTSAQGHLDGAGVLLSLLHLAGPGEGPLDLVPGSPVIAVLEVPRHAGYALGREGITALGMLCFYIGASPGLINWASETLLAHPE